MSALALALLPLVLAQQPAAQAADLKPYNRMAEFKPVVDNGIEIVAITQGEWVVPTPSKLLPSGITLGQTSIDIQLRITNRTGNDWLLPVNDTMRIFLKPANGPEIPLVSRGFHSPQFADLKPVVVANGTSYNRHWPFQFSASLNPANQPYLNSDAMHREQLSAHRLTPGDYFLRVQIVTSVPKVGDATKIDGIPIWSGNITTEWTPFKIIQPPPAAQ